jgi:glycosyltransferase involved in cell wall biosynthesis
MKRLAILTTHPIQYNAPLFQLLAKRKNIAIKVFYTWGQSKDEVFDARFGMKRSWDIPLLDGYEYEFIPNTSKHPDSNRFWGIINPGLLKKIQAFEPDAVLVYRWSVFSHFKIMQQVAGTTKLFFRGDSHLQGKQKGFKAFFKKQVLKFVFRKVDKAFYVGTYNKKYYLKAGLIEDQLTAAPHAVDNNRFKDDANGYEKKAADERRRLQIPEDAVVFLYAGKFYAIKQLDLLIETFQLVRNPKARLLLVGNGEEEDALKQLAKKDERILFVDFKNQSDMPWVYRLGDVIVLPSKTETWGLSVNEAMACGRAAIVSDGCGCAPELIIEGETGFIFKTGDRDELLKRLQQFPDNKVASKMGDNAFIHIKKFSLNQIAEAIEEAVIDIQ